MADSSKIIRTIGPDQRTALPGPPDGSFVREQYYEDGHVWIGEVTTQPGFASPWHHHGDHQTYAYVLDGEARVEFGVDGKEAVEAKADGSLHIIPGGFPHREINTGSVPNRFLIIRVGSGPPVVPLEGPQGSEG